MKDNVVSVLLWGKEICKLQWQGGYKEHFGKVGSLVSFNPEYHKFGFDVDPLGPYRTSVYLVQKGMSDICRAGENDGLPRFLSGSLPDDWGNQVFSSWMESNNIRRHSITSVDKLAFIGRRGMGGFEFVPEMYSPSTEDTLALEELYSLSKEIESMRDGFVIDLRNRPTINDLMEVGMSAGGKHPKAIIAINWETGEIRSGQVELPDGFAHYILKFRDSDSLQTAEIEFVYYLMAKECGIMMEECSLLPVGGTNHFLTKRFDRKEGRKIHAATLRALCGETTSYEDIFKICRKLKLSYQNSEELFRRAVFNYLACVCDDHDRNFSFIMDENGKWSLSPAYDETFTYNFRNPFIADRHYMTIDGCDRAITLSQMMKLARQNDIRNAGDIISEVSAAVSSFEAKAKSVGINKQHIEIIRDRIHMQNI